MARVIGLMLILLLSGCSTQPKKPKYPLEVRMKDKLFSNRNLVDNYLLTKDPLLLTYKGHECLDNWQTKVYEIKDRLRKETKAHLRTQLWFKLGNCFNYIENFDLALYYYDLVLGSKTKDTKIKAIVYYNTGQIYESVGQKSVALSYYENAYNLDDPESFSLIKLGVYEHLQAEFEASNKYFTQLLQRYPESELVKFYIGVNYFHLSQIDKIKNKVLPQLDEKSIAKILLMMAIDLESEVKKSLANDLNDLEVEFIPYKKFKEYLLSRL